MPNDKATMNVEVYSIKTKFSWPIISKKLDTLDNVLIMKQDTVKSLEEIELAHHLATKAMKDGTNIARKLKYEFLLWLSGKTDIKSAMKATAPAPTASDGTGDPGTGFLLICFGKCERIEGFGTLNKLDLKKKADPLDLERISLSRIKG